MNERQAAPGKPLDPGLGAVSVWPLLTLDDWQDTRETLQLWTQIVGKVRLGLAPMVNHWWQVPLYVSSRGLTTSLMYVGTLGLEIEFNFTRHVLEFTTTDGRTELVVLTPGSVANFHFSVMETLQRLGVVVPLLDRPVEMMDAIPFSEDEVHRSYDPEAAHRFWQALAQSQRVFTEFRSGFLGKVSPVHFFWGAADLAVTRFSGRRAPKHPGGVPNCADWVQQLAYSHEVSSCGFWPGGGVEGSFYSYAYPQPEGFSEWPLEHPGFFDPELGEFVLPYASVRTAEDPDRVLLTFLQNTYEAAATLLDWDRASLEMSEADRPPR